MWRSGTDLSTTLAWDEKVKGWVFRMEPQGKDGKRALFAEDLSPSVAVFGRSLTLEDS
jgi:hypothetical protein